MFLTAKKYATNKVENWVHFWTGRYVIVLRVRDAAEMSDRGMRRSP
jgi:hypothetical protein